MPSSVPHSIDAPIAYRARHVLPVSSQPIENGCVEVLNGRVVAVGPWRNQANTVDLADVVILPALVNAHTHLEFSDLKAPLGQPGMLFPDWIRHVLRYREEATASQSTNSLPDNAPLNVADGVTMGIDQSLQTGTRYLGEIATDARYPDAMQRAGGVRFLELIGTGESRMLEQSAVAREYVSADSRQRLPRGWRAGLSPHAPYTVGIPLLAEAVALSASAGIPLAMHLAETREELELLREGTGPFQELLEERGVWNADSHAEHRTPMDYLRMLAASHRALVIHGNYLLPAEWDFLREQKERLSLIYCPRTHAYFQHDRYPLTEILAAGVHTAIGTDSRASNQDLSLWRELQFIAKMYPEISPARIIELGTVNGAIALGDTEGRGTITPGGIAELITIPVGEAPVESIWGVDTAPNGLVLPSGQNGCDFWQFS